MRKIFAFLIPFFWMAFLTQNLPFSTMDDPTLIHMAKTTPAGTILSRIANPLTPTWSYQLEMQGGAEQNSLGLRPIELFIWKTLLALFGYRAGPFFLMKSAFLGLACLVIYLFVERLTGNRAVSFMAALFYAATLASFMSVFFISDFGFLAQFFQGLSILFFLSIAHRDNDSVPQRAVSSAGLFLSVWLGIKTYETVKILPFLFLAYLFFAALRNGRKFFRKENGILLVSVLTMLVLVIPFGKSFQAMDRGIEVQNHFWLRYHWDTLCRFLLQNTQNAWESEPNTAFFSLKSYLPFSLARTLGFFLCWAVVFVADAAAVRFKALRKKWSKKQAALLGFTVLWLLADVAALGIAKESDGRHLVVPLIPFTIFFAALIFFLWQDLKGLPKKAFGLFCLAGWVFSVGLNLDHQIYFRKFLGGFQIAQEKYLEFIYEDKYGRKPAYEDLIRFMRVPEALCVWHIPFIVDDTYSAFNERTQKEALAETAKIHGKTYVVTVDKPRFQSTPHLERIGEFAEINQSLFSDTILRLKKKKPTRHWVYRFRPV